ncbi:hypothetical protein BV22DRAFT_1133849 [Leucogyrophana mollusca]|uniref:Uncharacterized protein n=1 Tax=Leucogyrophana mollusca TaxID=85980 RepID=A0ACB8B3I5_9AGAM|nr:hypothetical protein BV22DRAFT_1133849 [Leucogyrophana mollusca]
MARPAFASGGAVELGVALIGVVMSIDGAVDGALSVGAIGAIVAIAGVVSTGGIVFIDGAVPIAGVTLLGDGIGAESWKTGQLSICHLDLGEGYMILKQTQASVLAAIHELVIPPHPDPSAPGDPLRTRVAPRKILRPPSPRALRTNRLPLLQEPSISENIPRH